MDLSLLAMVVVALVGLPSPPTSEAPGGSTPEGEWTTFDDGSGMARAADMASPQDPGPRQPSQRGTARGPAVKRSFIVRYLPLLGHVVPTLMIGYGWVIPRSCIAGWNDLTAGFGLSVIGTCLAYVLGQRAASSVSQANCKVRKTELP